MEKLIEGFNSFTPLLALILPLLTYFLTKYSIDKRQGKKMDVDIWREKFDLLNTMFEHIEKRYKIVIKEKDQLIEDYRTNCKDCPHFKK